MRFNKYVNWLKSDNNVVLFNLFNDEILFVNDEINSILQENKSAVQNIKKIHPSLYEELFSKCFIVDENFDETLFLVEKWNGQETDKEVFSITIIPTLNCNMSCWYCYEQHDGMLTMSTEILGRIKKLIKNKIRASKIKI